MFWIHGGSYAYGFGGAYNGDALVQQSQNSVVMVTINYRLNIFGFIGSKQLSKHTHGGGSGNFGIQDQRFAMQWVHEHIGAFGGDANDITIFGESAGGNSVINHLTTQDSFPFYKKAIVQSGAFDGAIEMKDAQEHFDMLLLVNKCLDLNCFVQKDAAALLESGALLVKQWG
jgi:para-nitrobenzyl esterase